MDRGERSKRGEFTRFDPVEGRGQGSKRVESLYRLDLSTLPVDPPRISDLLVQTFGGEVVWYTTPDGREFGTRPRWFDWPSVRGDEFGPPITPPAELVRQSRRRA